MCSDIAIKVSNLSKCYHVYGQPRDRMKQAFYPALQKLSGKPVKRYYNEFWALKDVSFEIRTGETVGIIGRNGGGKSTLLQLICGTLEPTSGTVETSGRIAALLELGSGFNPEFTGRENVFMNGAILGMTQQEIEARFDDIAAFADIGAFIEQPVKTYSSGMYLRLAFAVNIMSRPEIMVVDEALAVGDMSFQAKCMSALRRIQDGGATVLFVSHDIGSVKSLCSRGVYLRKGELQAVGPAPDIAERYIRDVREEANAEHRKVIDTRSAVAQQVAASRQGLSAAGEGEIFKRSEEFARRVAAFRYGTGGVQVSFVELVNAQGEPITHVDFNQKVKVRVFIEANVARPVTVNIAIFDDKKINITGCGFAHVGQPPLQTEQGGKYLMEYELHLPLQEGNYSVRVGIAVPVPGSATPEFLDVVNDAVVFRVGKWEVASVWSKVHAFAELKLTDLTVHDA